MIPEKILVITDNELIFSEFKSIISKDSFSRFTFTYRYSYNNLIFKEKYKNSSDFLPINMKSCSEEIINEFDLIISLHCKQLFDKKIVNNLRCINVHPGINPYNRGWYPQAFSIINKLPCGVTIHEMDEKLDHGDIIMQDEIKIQEYDTSESAYNKIIKLEVDMLRKKLYDIIIGNYKKIKPIEEGNVNYKKDFDKLLFIDKNSVKNTGELIDLLRALTFRKYKNAYFLDDNGNKIWINIELIPEEKSCE